MLSAPQNLPPNSNAVCAASSNSGKSQVHSKLAVSYHVMFKGCQTHVCCGGAPIEDSMGWWQGDRGPAKRRQCRCRGGGDVALHNVVTSAHVISCRFTRKNPGFPPIQTYPNKRFSALQAISSDARFHPLFLSCHHRKEIKIKIKTMKFLAWNGPHCPLVGVLNEYEQVLNMPNCLGRPWCFGSTFLGSGCLRDWFSETPQPSPFIAPGYRPSQGLHVLQRFRESNGLAPRDQELENWRLPGDWVAIG